ncbi:MAG: LptF/LptG family permease [Phycisphaerae bacterium]|nr:LptF/LptG family permease [Phycisphaerae bacterium]
MIKTIHWYLARDLARIWLLALIALTIMLTIFSVIEPLRRQQGITFEQILSFFGFMMPSMLSMALPVSALFAATVTYGRFSQDNEHLACRAGGVSTMSVLQPAFVLGLGVTILSLVLSNYLAPAMMKRGVAALEQNPKKIIYSQLETKHYYQYRDNYVHADRVDRDNDILHGLIYARWGDPPGEGIRENDKVRLSDVYRVTHIGLDGLCEIVGVDGGPVRVGVDPDDLWPMDKHRGDDLLVGDAVHLSDVWRVQKVNADHTYDLQQGDEMRLGVPADHVLPLTKHRDARIMIASQARVTLRDDAPEPFVEIDFVNVLGKRTSDGAGNMISEGQHQRFRYVPDSTVTRDRVPWLTWRELVNVAADPLHSPTITRELDKIRRDLRNDRFLQDLRQHIEESREYRRLAGATAVVGGGPAVMREFVVKADQFEETIGRRDKVSMGCRLTNADESPVQLEIWELRDDGRERILRQIVFSKPGPGGAMAIGVEYDELTDMSHVYLAMPGEVDVVTVGEARPQRFEDFSVGQLAIPPELLREVDEYDYEKLYAGADPGKELSQRSTILDNIREVRHDKTKQLLRAVKAETHTRLAYSSSCLLMVMLGAALGLIFRGGQFITAFATAAVPGAVVIIMLLMGKGIVKKVEGGYGLLAMWGGVVILAVATCIVYARLARK